MPAGSDPHPRLADIEEARARVARFALRTPLVPSALTRAGGPDILLKLEILQPTGSFKIRGASNAILALSEERRARGVVCCSTGNHGRAVAHVARSLGIPAVVCLSSLVPGGKVEGVRAAGADIRRIGSSQDEAQAEAERLAGAEGLTLIPPFDHPDVIAGQGTIALELLEERPDLAAVVVPLSGGGLIAGIALAAKAIRPGIRIVGVSMERGAAMAASLRAGRPVEVAEEASLADSLGGGIGLANRWTFRLCRDLVDEVVLLTEDEIYAGMRTMFFEERLIAEGASAVGHAALLGGRFRPAGPTALVLSGRNVDMRQFAAIAAGDPIRNVGGPSPQTSGSTLGSGRNG